MRAALCDPGSRRRRSRRARSRPPRGPSRGRRRRRPRGSRRAWRAPRGRPTSKSTVRSYCGWSSPASRQACGALNMVVSFRACPPMHPHRDARLATPTSRAAAGLGRLARHVPIGRLRRTCRPRRQHPPGLRKRQGTRAARARPVGSPEGPPKHTPLRQEMNKGRPLRACPEL